MAASHPLAPYTPGLSPLDLDQFLAPSGIQPDAWEQLTAIRPEHVSQRRKQLAAAGQTNSSIRWKLTTLRSRGIADNAPGHSFPPPARHAAWAGMALPIRR
jgi:hypothetical protein